ncbi:MAG: hypothetical protein IJF84_02520, partial [Thermoguttaceae bacterium]|nr:hypothetical protein [Thermoguttaceae bacterium]
MKKRFFPSNSPFQKTLVRGENNIELAIIKRPTGAAFGKRAAARTGSGASPPFFEKKVLPLKLPFPKNFSK